MYVLDTDILSLIHAGNERIGLRRDRVDPREIATTIVTRVEVLQARYQFLLKAADGEQLLRAQQRLRQSEELLRQIPILWIDDAAADEFNRLRRQKSLKKIGLIDLLIASIALTQHAILVTRNLRHFQQVPNLQVENWAD